MFCLFKKSTIYSSHVSGIITCATKLYDTISRPIHLLVIFLNTLEASRTFQYSPLCVLQIVCPDYFWSILKNWAEILYFPNLPHPKKATKFETLVEK